MAATPLDRLESIAIAAERLRKVPPAVLEKIEADLAEADFVIWAALDYTEEVAP